MWSRLQPPITSEVGPTTTASRVQRQRGHRAAGKHAEVASVDALKIWHNRIENIQEELSRPADAPLFPRFR